MAFKVKSIYAYASNHDDDLPFPIGQIITVTEEEDADWYCGEYTDDAGVKHEGLFPQNFVEKYEPTAPPRPQRTRTKRETEPAAEPQVASPVSPLHPQPAPVLVAEPDLDDEPEEPKAAHPPHSARSSVLAPAPAHSVPASAVAPEAPVPKLAEPVSAAALPPQIQKPAAPVQPKPKPSGPPPVTDKPSSSSFRDRIAAFNKPAAPPVAPFKPSGLGAGGGGFIKKPFVAPPPSKNAYVPPPRDVPVAKIYRRDEDPEIKEREAETLESAEKAGLVPSKPGETAEAGDEEQKPMSLKERLALLQKQQMEQAARHAEPVFKKEKPKRPPKKRTDTSTSDGAEPTAPPLERRDTEDTVGSSTLDEAPPPRIPHPGRRKSSKEVEARDGNEADLSGAGDTTEGPEDVTEKEDSDETSRHVATAAKQDDENLDEEEDQADEVQEQEEEEEEEMDEEAQRRERLRIRMQNISGAGGFGMHNPFAPPPMMPGMVPSAAKKKKGTVERRSEDSAEAAPPVPSAPAIPTPMALPGMSRIRSHEEQPEPEAEADSEDDQDTPLRTPHQESLPSPAARASRGAPPIPGGRPAPPPVPSDSRPPPPPPAGSDIKSPSEGSESDDEMSERTPQETGASRSETAPTARAPPPPPAAVAPPMPPISPRATTAKRRSISEEYSPTSPARPPNKRDSRLPPPIPGSAPILPPAQTRPPPPPPPGAPPSRTATGSSRGGPQEDDGEEEEITEYEGDYDTDMASSVPHRDALKAHQRESSFEDMTTPVRSPISEEPPSFPPPIPSNAPRLPPPIPSQPPPAPDRRKSVDFPRVAPPPPPPPKETPRHDDDEYDPYNYASSPVLPISPSFAQPPPPPPPARAPTEEPYTPEAPSYAGPQNPRGPPPAPPSNRGAGRQSQDLSRQPPVRRSVDAGRPSVEFGFVANEIDLASSSGWWLQPKSLPPQLQGRKDIFFESEESTAANPRRAGRMTVTRDIYVLYQDYSQTVIYARYDPQDASDVQLEQRHEPPPRTPRQDQLEQSYERFGRAIGDAAQGRKDTVVGDGTAQALVQELLRPFKDALLPIGTRAYGALIYSNMANASTTQSDQIRPGDIISIRNAKFQGKHGAMHAKYSTEVGKPDHVGVVAEWDGTKKKVRAWEQGREGKKVKMESFKLDDLRSGEVKIWRVMPRSWIGWEGGN